VKLRRMYHLKKGDLIVCKLPLRDFSNISLLTANGFNFIEESITVTVNLAKWNPDHFKFTGGTAYRMVPVQEPDMKTVQAIAEKTFTADRFHLDRRLVKKYADSRYKVWIRNSFEGGDSVYKLIRGNNTIVGFFIMKEYAEYADLRLAGLHPKHIGCGLGKLLYYRMYALLKQKKHTEARAAISCNNIPVMNIYSYLGCMKFIDPLYVFHAVI
jgi:L-amino acid N-acyltransferase YncA